uniref:protein ACCELERATED CELL DEATH 6-like n=1 Tax=Erigeron canadensis TaxID=72917 RepID=UPI001CB94593|nr:protein ACCELERATED CELL DEATH 6-like [Erigeron canadensis]
MASTAHTRKLELFKAAKNGFINIDNLDEQGLPMITSHRRDTLLHIAAFFGHEHLCIRLAEKLPNLMACKNFIGDTPLHVAARAGNLPVVKALVGLQVVPLNNLSVNEDGNTPLHEAVIHKQNKVVEFLLTKEDFKQVISDVNLEGKSPLYLAVESGNAQILSEFLELSGETTSSHKSTGGDEASAVDRGKQILAENMKPAGKGDHAVDIVNLVNGCGTSHTRVDEHFEIRVEKYATAIVTKDQGNAENSGDASIHSDNTTSSTASQIEDPEKRKCVLRAAISRKDIGILKLVADKVSGSVIEDNHILHLAASLGFLDGVKYLVGKFSLDVLKWDANGFCPIHLASRHGRLQVVKELLDHYPDAREYLSNRRQNILHVAAENGKDDILTYILHNYEWAEFLLNERDQDGYTPLHLATKNWHPKVVSTLTWDGRVNLKLATKKGLTALEIAENMEEMAPFKKRLTWMALMSVNAPRAQVKDADIVKRLQAAKYEPYNMDYCKDRVNTLLLVSALVATVTFAAGFTMPGGTKNSGKHEGMASMTHKIQFQLFVIFDSLAMYSSIIVAVILMWAQLGDLGLLLNALRMAQRLLGLSLTMMSLAFVTGVNLVVTEVPWISIVMLVTGSLSLIVLLLLFVPLFLPYISGSILARYISYYPFKLLILASES